ncbi:MAG: OB-fold nucleic acid binding domain-containing protein [Propionibacteriaceae bacterium]|nr:OB-fold nucleic acid binding domain-containing protein [Propionibacteriaceae bacterium]
MGDKPSGLLNRLKRVFTSSEELEDQDLAARAHSSGACPLSQCAERSRVKVRGTIRWVAKLPSGGMEAQLSDGTGNLSLVWMGPRRLECIQPGSSLLVSGRVCSGEDGPVMYNPEFEIVD